MDSNILFNIEGDGIYLYEPAGKQKITAKETARLERYFYPGLNKKKIMKLIGDKMKRMI